MGQLLDSNLTKDTPMKAIVGDRKILAGWSNALIGMHAGEVRAVVIPPELAYGAAGAPPRVPQNATLVFELHVEAVYSQRAEAMMADAESEKQALLLRMQKLGQQTEISHIGQTSSYAPTSTQAIAVYSPQQQQQLPQQQQQSQGLIVYPQQPQQVQAQPVQMQTVQPVQQVQQVQQPQPVQQIQPVQQAPLMSQSDTVKAMLDEREFRTDVSGKLTTLSTKIDEVVKKVDEFKVPPGNGSSGTVTGQLIIQTLQRLVEDNERQRLEVRDRTETIDALRRKISELQDRNQQYVEESNRLITSKDGAMKESIEHLRQQLMNLQSEKVRIDALNGEYSMNITKLEGQLTSLKGEKASVDDELRRTKDSARQSQRESEEAKQERTRAVEKAEKLQKSLDDEIESKRVVKEARLDLERRIEELSETIKKMEKDAQAAKRKAEKERDELAQTHVEEINEFRDKVARLEKVIQRLKDDAPDIEAIVAEAESKIRAKMEKAREEAEARLSAAMKDAEEREKLLGERNKKLAADLQRALTANATLESKNLEASTKLAEAQANGESRERAIKEMERKTRAAFDEFRQRIQSANEECQRTLEECEELKKKLQASERSINETKRALLSSEEELATVRASLSGDARAMQSEIEELHAKFNKEHSILEAQTEEGKKLKESLEAMKAEITSKTSKIAELTSILESKSLQLDEKTSTMESIQASLASANSSREQAKSSAEAAAARALEFESRASEAEENVKELRLKVAQLTHSLETSEKKNADLGAELSQPQAKTQAETEVVSQNEVLVSSLPEPINIVATVDVANVTNVETNEVVTEEKNEVIVEAVLPSIVESETPVADTPPSIEIPDVLSQNDTPIEESNLRSEVVVSLSEKLSEPQQVEPQVEDKKEENVQSTDLPPLPTQVEESEAGEEKIEPPSFIEAQEVAQEVVQEAKVVEISEKSEVAEIPVIPSIPEVVEAKEEAKEQQEEKEENVEQTNPDDEGVPVAAKPLFDESDDEKETEMPPSIPEVPEVVKTESIIAEKIQSTEAAAPSIASVTVVDSSPLKASDPLFGDDDDENNDILGNYLPKSEGKIEKEPESEPSSQKKKEASFLDSDSEDEKPVPPDTEKKPTPPKKESHEDDDVMGFLNVPAPKQNEQQKSEEQQKKPVEKADALSLLLEGSKDDDDDFFL